MKQAIIFFALCAACSAPLEPDAGERLSTCARLSATMAGGFLRLSVADVSRHVVATIDLAPKPSGGWEQCDQRDDIKHAYTHGIEGATAVVGACEDLCPNVELRIWAQSQWCALASLPSTSNVCLSEGRRVCGAVRPW
jgi:hypothetical protein